MQVLLRVTLPLFMHPLHQCVHRAHGGVGRRVKAGEEAGRGPGCREISKGMSSDDAGRGFVEGRPRRAGRGGED
jgi:hypothetical protein